MKCPCCGAALLENKKESIRYCEYCGFEEQVKVTVVEKTVEIPSRMTTPANAGVSIQPAPQVIEAYKDHNLELELVGNVGRHVTIDIPDSNIRCTLISREIKAFTLTPGAHLIRVNNHSGFYVVIPKNNALCKADFSIGYKGRIDASIKQPEIDVPEFKDLKNGLLPARKGLAIAALIVSCIPTAGLVGIVLAMVETIVARKTGRKPCMLALVAICVAVTVGMIWTGVMTRMSR